jgi:hypothetical protein
MLWLLRKIACPVAALAMLAGCGVAQSAVQPPTSSAANALPPAAALSPLARGLTARQLLRPSGGVVARTSWMSPSASGQDLVYVSDLDAGAVNVFTYPAGQQVGSLAGFQNPQGECVDAKGNVWLTNSFQSEIVEYAHGGTNPINRLMIIDQQPVGCSVDPTTGALAVTSYCQFQSPVCVGDGSVFVYANIKKQPVQYFVGSAKIDYFPAYDPHGNLFADVDENGLGNFGLAELKKGASAFTPTTLDRKVYFPGGLEWSGKYLAVGDQEAGGQHTSSVHQVAIAGARGKVVSTTRLPGSGDVVQFWIQGSTIVVPNIGLGVPNDIRLYQYPAGGSAMVFGSGLGQPLGAAVSLAQKG